MKSPEGSSFIHEEIARSGPLTFARFMARALYDPVHGYYASGRGTIGKAGDFFTNVSVGSVFGQLLAGQFAEMWVRLGRPDVFTIVEQGAHDGTLAADILDALPADFAAAVRYRIVEPTETLQARQAEKLGDRATWVASLADLEPFTGVHFSNELVDALPFHLLQSAGAAWEELFVAVGAANDLVFQPGPLAPEITALASKLPTRAPGTLLELRPAADEWLSELAGKLTAGFILIIDYGYPRDLLWAEHRTKGTFSCYRQHRRDSEPLADPGEKDITAHVDFTQLAETGEALGLSLEGFTDQHHFMVGAAEALMRELEPRALEPAARKTFRALQTLLHPESMGTQFRYLALSRNAEAGVLSGFRHARPAAAQLLAGPV